MLYNCYIIVYNCYTIVIQLLYNCYIIVIQLLYNCYIIVIQLLYNCYTIVIQLYNYCITIVKFHLSCLFTPNLFVVLYQVYNWPQQSFPRSYFLRQHWFSLGSNISGQYFIYFKHIYRVNHKTLLSL